MDFEDHDYDENGVEDQNDNLEGNFTSNGDGKLSRYQIIQNINHIDYKFGFAVFKEARSKIAWLLNMHPGEIITEDNQFLSAVNYYFIEENGDRFKISLPYRPYFYLAVVDNCEKEVSLYLSKKFAGDLTEVEVVTKEDLNLPNHLIGLQRTFLKLSFLNVNNLTKVKRDLMPRIRKNREKQKSKSDYADMLSSHFAGKSTTIAEKTLNDQIDNIIDIREHDVPYHVRVSIDLKIFVGKWYNVIGRGENDKPQITPNQDLIDWPEPIVLAFDIETTKEVLKFPDAKIDKIMMISYMIDGRGFLIVNREIVSQDVDDFEYTPKPEYEGCFTVYNEKNEYELLIRFFEHIQLIKPHIFVTYNGDFFDWPFVETRAASYNLNMAREIGFAKDGQGEYKSSQSIHMDAFKWVKRDSYLPMGSQNLKACTRAKLRYDPQELDPELMVQMAKEQPKVLASYSVSDAVATYYLYMKYVHPFIFALCTIIPMEPDEVLRKGSGTLCEALLMVQAYDGNIIFPNKQETDLRKLTDDGRLIDSETYVGGHVEALESGIFRTDLPCRFRLDPDVLKRLIDELPRTLRYSVEMEGISFESITNFEEKCEEVKQMLQNLIDCPNRLENPIIYHLDVGAMYPNIILTNRLQPQAIIDETVCAACDFNRPKAKCQRKMEWMWRAEVSPANRSEYQRILQQLENETFVFNNFSKPFHQLPKDEQVKIEKKRLQDYCRKAYRRLHETRSELRTVTVCQRENSFYVDTVKAFRDRRYEYKALLKSAKKKLDQATKSGDISEIKSCKSKEVLYDSLQLAHKCILNSFYGYVMRRGSRWHSMEMAGIVCYTGAQIITQAKELVEKVGRPLELDTDGIWCALPAGFPENITFSTSDEKRSRLTVSYPGAALNIMIRDAYTNDQYHNLVDKNRKIYKITAENSIAFEVDGPYKAMVLPASKEEGKRLKKRYAVFNFDGSLAELKGFEVKRRGELQLIKNFQSSVFDAFLKGSTLEEVYQCAASIADYWLDILFSKGSCISDNELFDLLSENRSLSRKLEDYGSQKSTSITVARRLAEFLGDEMVKDAGLNCKIVIASKPEGSPVTERAIPSVIFQAESSVKRHYLRKWTKCSNLTSYDIRDILDWPYYIERLGSAIQKIITIPAALQGVSNPVPRVAHPDWLHKRLIEKTDIMKQKRITDMFSKMSKSEREAKHLTEVREMNDRNSAGDVEVIEIPANDRDIEELCSSKKSDSATSVVKNLATSKKRRSSPQGRNIVCSKDKDFSKSWREALGDPPSYGSSKEQQIKWLSFLKKKWSYQLRQKVELKKLRKRSLRDEIESVAKRKVNNSGRSTFGLDSFVQKSVCNLFELTWKIVQIIKSTEPGLFYLWIFVANELRHVKLRVPKIFYINSKVPKEKDCTEVYSKVQRVLPRYNPVYNLYKYCVPEDKFLEHVNDLMVESSAPDIEGVYETQVPLTFRLLVELGCVCRLSEARRISAFEQETFTLADLEFLSLVHCDYLEKDHYKHCFLYHYAQDSRAIMAFFDTITKKADVWILDKGQNKNIPNLETMYNNERTKKISQLNDEVIVLPDTDYQFDVQTCPSLKELYRSVQRSVRSFKDQKRGSTLITFISKYDAETLIKHMPSLSDFPLIRIQISQPETMFSTLDWQRVGCKYMINYFLNYPNYFQTYLELCRYLHIPLGNVPADFAQFGADLFYARHLQRHNFVLWASPTDRPDLGGKEVDNNRLVTDFMENQEIKYNESGFYTSYCIELDVASLPVAAILQSHKISELEGVHASTGFDYGQAQYGIDQMIGGSKDVNASSSANNASYDETALCTHAFRILKNVVHSWVRDVANYSNRFADNQIIHFYRWLRSNSSLLYEPALKKILNSLMKKLFLLLVAEMKRLNVIVIYGDSTKLIICTKKRTYEDAMAYANFILESINKKDLFAPLDITVQQCWRILLWLDSANFGGIKYEQPKENDNDGDENDKSLSVLSEESDVVVDMNWNMMYFLPELAECQSNFNTLIAGYILIVYRHLEKQLADLQSSQQKQLNDASFSVAQLAENQRNGSGSQQNVSFSTTFTFYKNEKLDDDLLDYCRKVIGGEMTQKLLSIVQKIQRKIMVCAGEAGVSRMFPELPGSHLKLTNPALEFAKSICKVLSLDQHMSEESESLRSTLLKCLCIGEFSAEAEWIDPCLSYVLPEMICKFCGHCRDVDLCRDPYIYEKPNEFSHWRCLRCNKEYDLDEIEEILIQHLNRWLMSYCLQDLKCQKCKLIKLGNMNDRCECTGQFERLISLEDIENTLKVFSNLVRCYHMQRLEEALKSVRLDSKVVNR